MYSQQQELCKLQRIKFLIFVKNRLYVKICIKQTGEVQFMDCTLIVTFRFSRTGHTTLRAFGGVCKCGDFNACVCFDNCVGVLVICVTIFTVFFIVSLYIFIPICC